MTEKEACDEMEKRGWGCRQFGPLYMVGPIKNGVIDVRAAGKDIVSAVRRAIEREANP